MPSQSSPETTSLLDALVRLELVRFKLLRDAVGPFHGVLVFAVVQSLRYGFSANDYRWLISGSLASHVFASAYLNAALARFQNNGGTGRLMIASGGLLVAWGFAAYLILYRGIWAAICLFNSFEWQRGFAAIFFIAMGAHAIRGLNRLQSAGERLSQRRGDEAQKQ